MNDIEKLAAEIRSNSCFDTANICIDGNFFVSFLLSCQPSTEMGLENMVKIKYIEFVLRIAAFFGILFLSY